MTGLLPDWQSLTLSEKIGQMIVVRASGYLFDWQITYPAWEPPAAKLRYWLESKNLGGVILLGGSAPELALRTQQLQNWASIPLFIAADIEEGVGQRFRGATQFPPPMALGQIAKQNLATASNYAKMMGEITAKEALATGINWILAPVVDVNNNPDNPVINIRSFGWQEEMVSTLATAFIQGAKQYPILTAAKHFPGHGDTSIDSHLDLPVLSHSDLRLEEVEIPPFKKAIAAGVDSVMSAHLIVKEWDSLRPATLSPTILTEILRQKLGFSGLVVTDALVMAGVANYASAGEVAVMAIEAGADILLMPPNPEDTIEAITNAINNQRLTEERINLSLARIWEAKKKLQFPRDKNQMPNLFAIPEDKSKAESIVNGILLDSLVSGGNIPIKHHDGGRNLIVVDNLLDCDFLPPNSPAVALPEYFGYQLQLADETTLDHFLEDDSPLILQVFLRGNPWRGNAGLASKTQASYQYLFSKISVVGLLIYGSPYLLDYFQPWFPENLPWVLSIGQMPKAQAIACCNLFGLSEYPDFENKIFL